VGAGRLGRGLTQTRRCQLQFAIRPIADDDARAIAAWRYPAPYDFYDADRDPEDLAELLDPARRERRYFAVDDADGALVGFREFTPAAGVLDIGRGLRPDLTGRSIGFDFVEAALSFARERFAPASFRLAVAAFNRCAIRVYERTGFQATELFVQQTNGGAHDFVRMTRPA
jgi:[ribosomal protein S18]-alanine N-acetyltransferase